MKIFPLLLLLIPSVAISADLVSPDGVTAVPANSFQAPTQVFHIPLGSVALECHPIPNQSIYRCYFVELKQ